MADDLELLELVARFSRCLNYPRDEAGVQALAKGLLDAAKATGVEASAIVEQCAKNSPYCPTDADLLTVAKDIARTTAAIQCQGYQAPQKVKCKLCNDTGWQIVYALHTWEGTGYNYKRREWITKEQYDSLLKSLGHAEEAYRKNPNGPRPPRQEVYSAAKRCKCPVPADPTLVGVPAHGDEERR